MNNYAPNAPYQTALNQCLRHFQDSCKVAPQADGNPRGLQFGGGSFQSTHGQLPMDFYAPQTASGQPVQFGNQPPTPKKTGWFKKILIGAGLTAGLYFFSKKAASAVSAWATDKVSAKVATQISESIKPDEIGKNLGTSDFCIGLIKKSLLGVAGKYLPEPAVKLLDTQATPDNIRRVLDAGLLSNALKYGGELYGQNAGHFRDYVKTNADTIADQLARLTGFQKTKIADCLKQFS